MAPKHQDSLTTIVVPDWERIEVLYRAGVMSVREIALHGGVSHTAINKRAAKEKWARDLGAKIKAEADAKLSRALVSKEVAAATKITEQMTVEVEAEVQARIRLAHRADIAKCRSLAMKLLAELEHETDHGDLYRQLIDLLAERDDESEAGAVHDERQRRRRREVFDRATSLAGRIKTLKDLAETMRILIDKEREAFNIGNKDVAEKPQEVTQALREFFAHLHAGAGRVQVVKAEYRAVSVDTR